MKYGTLVLGLATLCILGTVTPAGAGEPLSLGALFGPEAGAVLKSTIPAAMDIAQKACKATADQCGIKAVKVADLPEVVRRSIEASFPKGVVEGANLHFDMPLNDPQMGIGFLNTVGMIASGGGAVMGMTFGNDIYVECSQASLSSDPESRSLVGHELVHVAQYQAMGFSKYKELYAKETATKNSYEDNALEKEAFLYQDRFARAEDRGFFAFYRSSDRPEQVATRNGKLVALDDVAGLDSREVAVTAANESLARQATLVLGSDDPATGRIAPQILDTHGGAPLHTFNGVSAPLASITNVRAGDAGPYLVAVSTKDGVEIAWRTSRGFRSERFPADATLEAADGSTRVIAGNSRWHWTGESFARD
ncbi:MAG: DUF4157 domain-containing protein [FCB group bacterium]|nr:DUF4157 domain-containing protein [FCB group bacterium]